MDCMQKERNDLSIEKQYELIQEAEKHPYFTQYQLAKDFKISQSAVSKILKRKSEIKKSFETVINPNTKRIRGAPFELINEKVYEFFSSARATGHIISGPIIKSKALEIAQFLKIPDFKASDGWLDKFKNRYGLVYKSLRGEANSVDQKTEAAWIEHIRILLQGMDPKNVYNCDETALFFRALPNKSLVSKLEECRGTKLLKDRISVLFCANWAGERLPPLVIGRCKRPRCFGRIPITDLPVEYAYNRKAWMTGELFRSWLRK